jgi:hypothetical protein
VTRGKKGQDAIGPSATAPANFRITNLPNDDESPEAQIWDSLIGPFYDRAGALRLSHMSWHQLEHFSKTGRILRTRTQNGDDLYPCFQFGPAGEPLAGLSDVLSVLDPGLADSWGDALWLNAALHRFNNRSAAELMREGKIDAVITAARNDRARWDR